LEFHISIGASSYESLLAMNVLYTQSAVFEIVPEDYLFKWMEEHTETLSDGNTEIHEFYFNTQKLLVNIHKSSINLINQSEKEKASILYSFADRKLQIPHTSSRTGFLLRILLMKLFAKISKLTPAYPHSNIRLDVRFHYAQRLLRKACPFPA
jgi:hypothetical protein